MTLPAQLRTYSQTLAAIGQTDGALIVDGAANELDRLSAEVGQLQAAFKCFRCGDAHTPLYCLNCAEELRVSPVPTSPSLVYGGVCWCDKCSHMHHKDADCLPAVDPEQRALLEEKLRDEHTRWSHAPRAGDGEATNVDYPSGVDD